MIELLQVISFQHSNHNSKLNNRFVVSTGWGGPPIDALGAIMQQVNAPQPAACAVADDCDRAASYPALQAVHCLFNAC